jgi:signal transduction histidine kinase
MPELRFRGSARNALDGADAPSGEHVALEPFESLLIPISTRLTAAQWHEVGAEIDSSLHQVLEFYGLDHLGVFEMLDGHTGAFLRHVAGVPGTPAIPSPFSYEERFPWTFRNVARGMEGVSCASPKELPAEASVDKASMQVLGLRSLVHIPLEVSGKVLCILTAGYRRDTSAWTESRVARLAALGGMFAHAIARAEAVAASLVGRHDTADTLAVAHLGRWEWDIGAGKLHLSHEAKHILGADVPDMTHFLELVESSDRAHFENAIAYARVHPRVRFKARYTIRTPAGEARTIHQWHELLFPGERTARLVATVQDVTAVAGTQREITALREHQWHSARVAQTTLLVASLAHELCQPLTAMLNNAQAGLRFLSRGDLDVDEMRDLLTDIVASNRKASEVLGALRAMLRRQNTNRIIFDGLDAVHDVLALVRSELMTEQIDVETSLEAGCFVNADKTQIEQVLLNLIMNSIDAMRGCVKRLRLTVCATEDEHVEVAVEDSGSGIARDKRSKIFEAFWTTKEKGLGMGLPLCRAIVESYGGRIWCEDNHTGGVTFRFRLPAAQQEQPFSI